MFSLVTIHRHMTRVSRFIFITAAAIVMLALAFASPTLAQDVPSDVTADEVNLGRAGAVVPALQRRTPGRMRAESVRPDEGRDRHQVSRR